MVDLSGIIKQLVTERERLNNVIAALQGVDGVPRRGRPAGKRGISAAGRARIAAAQRARWAKFRRAKKG